VGVDCEIGISGGGETDGLIKAVGVIDFHHSSVYN